MSGAGDSEGGAWETFAPEVPADLTGVRVLDVGPRDEAASAALRERGGDVVELRAGEEMGGGFGLILCRDALGADPHPMRLLSRLWHAGEEGATLLLAATIATDPEASRFARFGAAEPDRSFWLPGLLALRWSVEVSGWEVERRFGAELDAADGPSGVAYLRAHRTGLVPALDRATPPSGE